MALTKGFKSALHPSDHFRNHGARLGIGDEGTYLRKADSFLGSPKPRTAHEFRRSWNNDLVRYDPTADEYGVLDEDGYIKTYYKPDPEKHGFRTNWDYFEYERARTA